MADLRDQRRPGPDLGVHRPVAELRVRHAVDQAAVQGLGRDHRDAAPRRLRQQFVHGLHVEQRVDPGLQHRVQVGLADEPGQHRRLGHPHADRADHALVPQRRQGGPGAGQRLIPVVVGVVDEDHVHAVHAQPAQALLQRGQDAVPREVVDPVVAGARGVWVAGPDQAPDLRAQHVVRARPAAQRLADQPLGAAAAVHRRRVEVPHPAFPGGVQAVQRHVVRHRGLGDGRGAEGEGGQVDLHAFTLPDSRSTRQYRWRVRNRTASGMIDTRTPAMTIEYCAAWPPVMTSRP